MASSSSVALDELTVALVDGVPRVVVKATGKDVRWCNAFTVLDKTAKDFMNTIPLIQSLGNKAMRPRHWDMIMKVTHKTFTPPHADRNMLLANILDLNLHEYAADVDEVRCRGEKGRPQTPSTLLKRWHGPTPFF